MTGYKTLRFFLLSIILLTSACSRIPVKHTEVELQTRQLSIDLSPTMNAIPTTTRAITPEPTKGYNPLPTKTVSPARQLTNLYENLKSGQYIVYTSLDTTIENPTTADLNIISLDGKTIKTITRLEYGSHYFVKLSPDLKQVAYISLVGHVAILELDSGAVTNVPVKSCLGLDWSPDSTELVMACDNIYAFSVLESKLVRLTNHGAGESTFFNAITWSPDGEWIMVHSIYDNMWDRNSGGELYLIDSNCTANADTCLMRKQPFDKVRSEFYSPTWSPDSHFLAAFLSDGVIGVWDIEGNASRKISIPGWQKPEVLPEWGHLAWSPDGEWFAYSQADTHEDGLIDFDLFVIPVNGGKPKLILDNADLKLVMGWMILPDLLQ